ncbi:putative MFS-type transporter [Cupriavidus necator H850]|uniref:MFS transporter n=1 Tax=Cupriavidus necator TaxID=106590 RepID=UPI00129EC550|nr:MFS transporter [Cupriavidus necator]KAI3596425.1 putative MFS-type transporter [Cupriavidus necator H850]
MTSTKEVAPAEVHPGALEDEDASLYRRVIWKLVPILFISYAMAYLDRINVGFAKLQMLTDLQFSETIYGLGAGIFFIGYFIFEVPSNLVLHRVGARRWIARIMITWGLLSCAMMFVRTPTAFYVLRFLLGVAEAGFFPGIVLYLTYWIPASRIGKPLSLFFIAVPVAGVVGGPLSGWILQSFHDIGGLRGWQWMFLIEGLPTILLGILVLVMLRDRIDDANWLSQHEKSRLRQNLAAEQTEQIGHSIRDAFTLPIVWVMCLIEFCIGMGIYGMGFWMPTLIREAGIKSLLDIGLFSAIPYGAAIVAMIWVARVADARRDRKSYLALASLIGAIALMVSMTYKTETIFAIAALTVATAAILTAFAQFWRLPTLLLGGRAAAAGIAVISSVANLSGFMSPYLVGWLRDTTGNGSVGMYLTAGSLVLAAVIVIALPSKLVNR